jgi:hypothetical protein
MEKHNKRTKYSGMMLAVGASLCLLATGVQAQERTRHINPVIEKLASGKPFIGVSTGNLSVEHARALTRSDIDYVYVDMEHNPLDFTALKHFTLGTLDPAAIAKRGEKVKADLAVFARFPPLRAGKGGMDIQASTRYRVDGRHLQFDRQRRPSARGGQQHALSADEGFQVS